MFIQTILTFIDDLKRLGRLLPIDMRLHQDFLDKFGQRLAEDTLNSDDIQFLMNCFKERCREILGSKNDYMVDAGLANKKWIQLAKDLATFTEKGYLKILLPDINNTVDYNYISLLTETNRLENFYLGEGNKVLYRKRGLGEHLQKNQYYLSTCRDLRTNKLSAVSVDELSRLHASRNLNSAFSIGDESFNNFWDFLQKKVFVTLQSKGSMPLDLLPHLLGLIEEYYTYKNDGADFKSFKQATQLFLKIINKNELKDINYFYGIEIQYKDKKYLLLDFLIVIAQAQFYVIDEHLEALMEWMFKLNPVLAAKNEELKLFYTKLQDSNFISSKKETPKQDCYGSSINPCLNFLLSLMTTEFDMIPFTGDTISLWDRTNSVFTEASLIFSLFEPILRKNRIDELVPQYHKVIQQYIIPAREDKSIFTWATRFNSVNQWYQHVENNTLSEIGVNWFEPELLIYALLQFKTHNLQITSQIHKFLDELVHTYAQKNYTLMKQFRVNIIFIDFMKMLPTQERQHLMILLELSKNFDVKHDFMSNCIHHIVSQLSHMTSVKSGGSVHFFSGNHRVDFAKLMIPYTNFDHLNKVIDSLKARLHSPSLHLNPELLEQMTLYLRTLSRPISTIEEQQQTSSSNTSDYIGAPT